MPPIRRVLVLAVDGAESLDVLGPVEVFEAAIETFLANLPKEAEPVETIEAEPAMEMEAEPVAAEAEPAPVMEALPEPAIEPALEAEAVVVDEGAAAYRAGAKRARALAGRPYDEFRRKLGDLLLRRGFSYETAGLIESERLGVCWPNRGSIIKERLASLVAGRASLEAPNSSNVLRFHYRTLTGRLADVLDAAVAK